MATDQNSEKRTVKEEFNTQAGVPVKVFRGKAKHMVNAQRMTGGDSAKAQLALCAQLVEVDGKMLTMEDWAEADLDLYMEVVGKLFAGSSTTPAVS
jgi:hypothetical protein